MCFSRATATTAVLFWRARIPQPLPGSWGPPKAKRHPKVALAGRCEPRSARRRTGPATGGAQCAAVGRVAWCKQRDKPRARTTSGAKKPAGVSRTPCQKAWKRVFMADKIFEGLELIGATLRPIASFCKARIAQQPGLSDHSLERFFEILSGPAVRCSGGPTTRIEPLRAR